MKHHKAPHHSGRSLASKIMRDPSMSPAGFTGGPAAEQSDRMGMRGARGVPPPAPSGGGFGISPGPGGGPLPGGPPPAGPPPGLED
jgi:hypothetical protein